MNFSKLNYQTKSKLFDLSLNNVEHDHDASTDTHVWKYTVDSLVFTTTFESNGIITTRFIDKRRNQTSVFDFTPPVVLDQIKKIIDSWDTNL